VPALTAAATGGGGGYLRGYRGWRRDYIHLTPPANRVPAVTHNTTRLSYSHLKHTGCQGTPPTHFRVGDTPTSWHSRKKCTCHYRQTFTIVAPLNIVIVLILSRWRVYSVSQTCWGTLIVEGDRVIGDFTLVCTRIDAHLLSECEGPDGTHTPSYRHQTMCCRGN
jgi:hypothetical protein